MIKTVLFFVSLTLTLIATAPLLLKAKYLGAWARRMRRLTM